MSEIENFVGRISICWWASWIGHRARPSVHGLVRVGLHVARPRRPPTRMTGCSPFSATRQDPWLKSGLPGVEASRILGMDKESGLPSSKLDLTSASK
jgi:hypothetical protein